MPLLSLGLDMRRRTFLGALGASVAAWPLVARGQQTLPVIGFLSAISEAATLKHQAQFRRGLSETGFVPGQNVLVEYRWADGQYDRLQGMAVDFVRRKVDVIAAQGPPAAIAARTATITIPIVFAVGIDPVAAGLVESFNRPGGNATGTTLISGPLGQKRLEILRELVPHAKVIAMVVNPTSPDAPPEIRDVQATARTNGLQLRLLNASTTAELDAVFAALEAQRPDAVLIGGDPFYLTQAHKITERIERAGLVTVHAFREFTEVGGLVSYGTNIASAYRQVGIYVGRILKGAKPADLPVLQPTTFELVINLKAAKAQRVDIPPSLHARSDEVIE
jgi:putative tryptophan/tyrosine transport system substrate-binding protein